MNNARTAGLLLLLTGAVCITVGILLMRSGRGLVLFLFVFGLFSLINGAVQLIRGRRLFARR